MRYTSHRVPVAASQRLSPTNLYNGSLYQLSRGLAQLPKHDLDRQAQLLRQPGRTK
jgi:hypothetical protein